MFVKNMSWLFFCVYFEARGESREAQIAVAHVILNRSILRRQSIRDVVTANKQFSWYNKGFIPVIREPESLVACIEAVMECCERRANGDYFHMADHYYDDSIDPPEWSKNMKRLGKIDSFYFFKR